MEIGFNRNDPPCASAAPRRDSKKHNRRSRVQVWMRCWQGDTGCQFDCSPCFLPGRLCSPPPSRFPSRWAGLWWRRGPRPLLPVPVRGPCKLRGEQRAEGGASDSGRSPSRFHSQRGFFFFLTNWLLDELQAFSLCLVCYCCVLLLLLCPALTSTLSTLWIWRAKSPRATRSSTFINVS